MANAVEQNIILNAMYATKATAGYYAYVSVRDSFKETFNCSSKYCIIHSILLHLYIR